MAKGDKKKVDRQVNLQRQRQLGSQAKLGSTLEDVYGEDRKFDTNLRNELVARNTAPVGNFGGEAYEGYRGLAGGLGPGFYNDFNKYMGNLDESINQYRNFANTGGFTEADLQNIRARNVAPTRAIYSNVQDDLARKQAITGAQNIGASKIRAAREANQAIADATTSGEANIAQLVQQGKQFGTAGMQSAALGGADARSQVAQVDAAMRAQGLGGMTDIEKMRLTAQLERENNLLQLYGQEGASGRGLDRLMGHQGESTSQNLNLIGRQIEATQIPSDFSQAMGNIGQVAGLGGQVAGAFMGGIPGLGGGRPGTVLPSRQIAPQYTTYAPRSTRFTGA